MTRNYLSSMQGGWLGDWIKWKYNQLSPQLGWAGAGGSAWQKRNTLISVAKKLDLV